MSYSRIIAFCNVLYGIKVPHRNGQPLGNTEFCDQRAAYDGLPEDLKRRLAGKTVLHDFNKFWEMMRREKGSARPPLTEAQRAAKPPASHPIFLVHPITGRKCLYANPGYAVRINELPEKESDEILEFLFEHQTKPEYRYAQPLAGGRRADVGQHADDPQRGGGLPRRRAAAHQALPGDGDAFFREAA